MKYRLHSEKNKHSGITMGMKLLVCVAVFTCLSVFMVWIVQIFMSDALYENVKKREMESTAKHIKEIAVDGYEDIFDDIDKYAHENDICIGFYSIVDGVITEKHTSLVFVDNIIYNASDEMLHSIYSMANNNGGDYKAKFAFDLLDYENDEKMDIDARFVISSVYAKVFSDADQNEYMILLNSNITPLNAAKKTFGAQFSFTMLLLVIFAMLMGFIMSRLISIPLKSMTASAKELAKGRYDVKFSGSGYREISELSETLNYAAEELAKNDHLQKELIANISHDLRTPLTMIKGYAEIMRDIPGENTPENIQAVIDETTRLAELVNDILDLSKIESGAGKFEAERFDFTEAVDEVLCRFEQMCSVGGFDIRFSYDRKVDVIADRSMILQVVYNLVSNAVNFSGEDKFVGVEQAVFTGENGKKFVRISVEDHGEGIKKEDLSLIWDRYYKVEGVHKRATVGTGIGLSIVKKVLERHGAAYGVESTVGKGSTFWFDIPLAE